LFSKSDIVANVPAEARWLEVKKATEYGF
jgi:hypothetical protein